MASETIRLGHRVEYACWHLAGTILRLLPRRAAVLLACATGWLMYRVLRLRRNVVMGNLTAAFGDTMAPAELDRIALESYQNSVLTFFEFINPPRSKEELARLFLDNENPENLEEVRNQTIIGVTAHIGNWELVGSQTVLNMGLPLTALMKPMHNPLVNAEIVRQREALGLELVSTDSVSLKGAVDMARRGRWLVFLADQDARRHGIFVEFLGQPASTAEGPALFSWKLNLPLFCGFCVREKDPLRRMRLIFRKAVWPDPKAPRDTEIRRLTEAHVRELEAVVRAHPESYFWLHRRWKTRPKAHDLVTRPTPSSNT